LIVELASGVGMKVAIHAQRFKGVVPFVARYRAILEHNGVPCDLVDADSPALLSRLRGFFAFIYRMSHEYNDAERAMTLLDLVERDDSIKVFPNAATRWSFDDKIRQTYLFQAGDVPHAATRVFWEKPHAMAWATDEAEYPVVFKLKGGAGSTNVVLVRSARAARRLIRKMFWRGIRSGAVPGGPYWRDFSITKQIRVRGGRLVRSWRCGGVRPYDAVHKDYALFQEFCPGNAFDTRVTVIGGRAFAFRRFTRENDFRSSGSGRIDWDAAAIDVECVRIALDTSRRLGFQSMAYDFLYDKDSKPVVCECCYSYNDRAVFQCAGYWDEQLQWREGHYWPQYWQLVDLLGRPDFEQPPCE
jgi:glutathione synthase/RimK-type ligase-like ATP-grasp enzyme